MGSFKIEHLIKSSGSPEVSDAVSESLSRWQSAGAGDGALLHFITGAALVLLEQNFCLFSWLLT